MQVHRVEPRSRGMSRAARRLRRPAPRRRRPRCRRMDRTTTGQAAWTAARVDTTAVLRGRSTNPAREPADGGSLARCLRARLRRVGFRVSVQTSKSSRFPPTSREPRSPAASASGDPAARVPNRWLSKRTSGRLLGALISSGPCSSGRCTAARPSGTAARCTRRSPCTFRRTPSRSCSR